MQVASGVTKKRITELTVAVGLLLLTRSAFVTVVTFWPAMSLRLPHLLFK